MILDDLAALSDDHEGPGLRVALPPIPLLTLPPEQFSNNVDTIMHNASELALHAIGDAIALVAPHDQGELANSFRQVPATPVGGIELTGHSYIGDGIMGRTFSSLPQAVVLEDGRAP